LKSQENAIVLTATNTGQVSCTIAGYAAVALRQSRGGVLPFRYSDGGGIFVTSAPAKSIALQRGGSVYLLIATTRCTDGVAGSATSADVHLSGWTGPEHVALTAPGRGASITTCRDYPYPDTNTVWVSPFARNLSALVP
jgi:hypothetical protein